MRLCIRRFNLKLRHRWAIANDLAAGSDGSSEHSVVFVELDDGQGVVGLGETAPSRIYGDSSEAVEKFLCQVDPQSLSFEDVPGSMTYLASLPNPNRPAYCAINLALLDGAAKAASQPVHEFLGLPFENNVHLSSLTIGIDTPGVMAQKALEAVDFPVLKLKLGSPADQANFRAIRQAAPDKTFRVDANAGWKNREEALEMIEWLANQGGVEFIEQPLAPDTRMKDLAWLKKRSPLPLFADESYHTAADIDRCADVYHGVNVKLVKAGGITAGKEALEIARRCGLKTMIGCMMESSLLLSAAAHLAALADYLDLDSNVLIVNDPMIGVKPVKGRLRFDKNTPPFGLRAQPVSGQFT
jgi:L-alanine-DL-glutamate epimerase-like enolase superfamily enzyme